MTRRASSPGKRFRVLPDPLLASLLKRRDIWRRIALERLTEPIHLNLLSLGVAAFGTYRARIAFDLVVRQEYAFGLLQASKLATERGLSRVTVAELGVGAGTGLLNLQSIARRLERATGIAFDIVGFDSGRGLPAPADYRDHPEAYREGWYPMAERELRSALSENTRLVLGPLAETVPAFVATLSRESPLGFVALDVDYYSSARDGLALFAGPPEAYFPWLPVYVDDIRLPSHNTRAGETLAIDEFNRDHEFRAIERDRFLIHRRIFKRAAWVEHMYTLHVLDHPERRVPERAVPVRDPGNPYLRDGVVNRGYEPPPRSPDAR